MKKIKDIFKIILESLLIFCIFYIWLDFYLKNNLYATLISLAMTGLLEGILQGIRIKKNGESFLKEKEKIDAQKTFISLAKRGDFMLFFKRLFSSKFNQVNIYDNIIQVEKQGEKIVIIPFIKFKSVCIDDVLSLYHKANKLTPNKIIILCGDIENNVTNFIKNMQPPLIILDQYQTYISIYKEFDFFPEMDKETPVNPTFKNTLSKFFNPSHARGFIFSALFLLVGSFFTKMNLYYLICTSLLMIFGLISLCNKKHAHSNFTL